jgi:hypothetical protein
VSAKQVGQGKPSSAHYIEQYGYTKEVMDETLSRLHVAFGVSDDEPPRERKKLLPHCDCKGASEAAGKVVGKYHKAGASNEMVPTSAVDGFCTYCKHAAFTKPLGFTKTNAVDSDEFYLRAKKKRRPRPDLVALWERDNQQPATKGNRRKAP